MLSNHEVSAAEPNTISDRFLVLSAKEELTDGSYIIYSLYCCDEFDNAETISLPSTFTKTAYTKNAVKNAIKYDSKNKIIWTYTLTASFSIVEGQSSSCTSVDYSTHIDSSAWSFNNGSSRCEQNTAYGNGVFTKKILWVITSETVNIDLALSCDSYGNIS